MVKKSKVVKILSFVKCPETSVIASVRIARFVSDKIGVPITVGPEIADGPPADLLIIVNGAYAFCDYLEQVGAAVLAADRVAWIQNDYTIIPPKNDGDAKSPFRRAFVERRERGYAPVRFWTTCEDWAKLPDSSYINWNALTFDPSVKSWTGKGDDIFYYGAWRSNGNIGKEGYRTGKAGREIYFDRYFKRPLVPVTISSPAKQFREKYGEVPNVRFMDRVSTGLSEEIAKHGMGLYIEDRMSHERYHSPANRFYEMLCTGTPMVFQPECGTMLRRAGYDPSPYAASSPLEVQRAFDKRREWAKSQGNSWWDSALKERENLDGAVKKLVNKEIKS